MNDFDKPDPTRIERHKSGEWNITENKFKPLLQEPTEEEANRWWEHHISHPQVKDGTEL